MMPQTASSTSATGLPASASVGGGGVDARLSAALAAVRAGREAEGLAELDALAAEPAGRLQALPHRAWFYLAKGEARAAARDYAALGAEQPGEAIWLAMQAQAEAEFDGEAALGHARAALALDPHCVAATLALFRAQIALGCPAGAGVCPPRPWFPNLAAQLLAADPNSFPFSVTPAVGAALHWIMRMLRPQVAVGIGSNIGFSTLFLAQALKDEGRGRLHCFDLFTGERPASALAPGLTSLAALCRRHLEHAGLLEWVELHAGDSSSNARRALGALKEPVDFAFIDGDHTIRGCLKDWSAVDEFLRPGGVVALHDTHAASGWLGPEFLLKSLAQCPGQYQALDFPTADTAGLALVRKLGKAPSPQFRPTLFEMIYQRVFQWTRKN